MKAIKICPFCGHKGVIVSNNKDFYHCNECKNDFKENDLEHELLRQKISAICSGRFAFENSPINCSIGSLIIGEYDSVGLSSLELPQVSSIYQDYEGILWVTIYDCVEPFELNDLSTSDLIKILGWLEENSI